MLTNVTFSMNIAGVTGAAAEQVLVGDFNGRRPANVASHFRRTREKMHPLTDKLMDTHDDGYGIVWS